MSTQPQQYKPLYAAPPVTNPNPSLANPAAFNNKVITIPFSMFVALLFNDQKSFLETADAYSRERMYVSKTVAELLRIWDKDGMYAHVLAPRTEFNDTANYVAYTAEAWRASEPHLLKIRAEQQFSASQITLREEKIKELSHKLEADIGFDKETAEQLARMKIMRREVTWCLFYGVDISGLTKEHTQQTRVL
jgi:hypothetical protein